MYVESCKSTFEKIAVFTRIPYTLFWLGIGSIDFLLGKLLIWVYAENSLFYNLLIMCTTLATLPLINIWFFYSFKRLMKELSLFFWENKEEFEIWYKNTENYIFTFNSWQAKFVTGFILIAGLATVLSLGLPFKSAMCNIAGLSAFAFLLIFCGTTLHTSIGLLITLRTRHKII